MVSVMGRAAEASHVEQVGETESVPLYQSYRLHRTGVMHLKKKNTPHHLRVVHLRIPDSVLDFVDWLFDESFHCSLGDKCPLGVVATRKE